MQCMRVSISHLPSYMYLFLYHCILPHSVPILFFPYLLINPQSVVVLMKFSPLYVSLHIFLSTSRYTVMTLNLHIYLCSSLMTFKTVIHLLNLVSPKCNEFLLRQLLTGGKLDYLCIILPYVCHLNLTGHKWRTLLIQLTFIANENILISIMFHQYTLINNFKSLKLPIDTRIKNF